MPQATISSVRLILAHAAHLFARRGYSAASMNEVAEACGLSKAALYYYYRSKYACC